MSVKFAVPLIGMSCGALLGKPRNACDRLPERVAAHVGMAPQKSKTGLAAVVLIALLGQAAPPAFVLLRVGGAAALFGSI